MSLEKLEALFEAYANTEYVVPDLGLSLCPGSASPAMDRVLTQMNHVQAVIMTAHNPLSVHLSARLNEHRHRALECALSTGDSVYRAYGRGIKGDWPVEESLCVFGMPVLDADGLADQFDQLGYLLYADGQAWLRIRPRQAQRWLAQQGPSSG